MRTAAHRSADIGRTGTDTASRPRAHSGDTRPRLPEAWSERMVATQMSPFSFTDHVVATGSLDGDGSADHDQPYQFGFRPRANAPYPFNTRQYARLLILRGCLHDSLAVKLELLPFAIRRCNVQPAA